MPGIADYEPVIGPSAVHELRALAAHLTGQRILMVNSTRVGGGVAEILNRMVPLMTELGLSVRWEVIGGSAPFYAVTKKFHNALHGKPETFSQDMFDLFLDVGRLNARQLALDEDLVLIHDPQPITLVEVRSRNQAARWVWRCHVDVSHPAPDVWDFLRSFIRQFDAAIYSAPAFTQPMKMRQVLIAPSIDPLSDKNRELPKEDIDAVLRRLAVPRDVPILTQVSRFDYLKDPLGVIEAFRRVRKSLRCRLVLAGGPASDDPEGEAVLNHAREEAQGDSTIHLLMLPPNSDVEINALQRASAVVIQKSIREGFGLTVSEALWKARPVVASAVGGIPLQVKHRYNGLLVHSVEGAAFAIKQLLSNPDYARRLGENGRAHVRQNFLLTRHLADYLLTFLSLSRQEETIYLDGEEGPRA
jgi:trehalose synthase